MLLRRITSSAAPVASPILLAHLRQPDEEAGAIEAFRLAAHDLVGEMSGRVLGSETWAVSVGEAPNRLDLPKSPVQSLVSITYYDAAGTVQTATLSDFHLFADDDRAVVTPKDGKTWPPLQKRDDAMTVTFIAGYTVLPPALSQAVLMVAGHLYENRSAVSEGAMSEVPMAVQALTAIHRIGWAAG
jgi:uncharacterized phiE125 gp8 family phage protein